MAESKEHERRKQRQGRDRSIQRSMRSKASAPFATRPRSEHLPASNHNTQRCVNNPPGCHMERRLTGAAQGQMERDNQTGRPKQATAPQQTQTTQKQHDIKAKQGAPSSPQCKPRSVSSGSSLHGTEQQRQV
jgi:hypothetical protein